MGFKGLGLVYDPIYLEHDTGGHVEQPKRLTETLAVLEAKGITERLVKLSPRAAAAEEVAQIHTRDYFKRLASFCQAGGGHLDPDTVASPRSFEVALAAVGGLLNAVDAVQEGTVARAFALVRPPGHHALPHRAMGFCLFNNVAVAARYARQKYGIDRILIVDWDYHHGNGTEAVFYAEPGVLYFSTHSATGYPGTGRVERVGEGPGEGFNVNIPLPDLAGDEDFGFVFDEILVPVAEEYSPGLVLVSAGQDGYRMDPIAGMDLTPRGYGLMAAAVRRIADRHAGGRLVGCLEGGYHLPGLGECVCAILEQWAGKEGRSGDSRWQVKPEVEAAAAAVKRVHRSYWRCFAGG